MGAGLTLGDRPVRRKCHLPVGWIPFCFGVKRSGKTDRIPSRAPGISSTTSVVRHNQLGEALFIQRVPHGGHRQELEFALGRPQDLHAATTARSPGLGI